MQLNILDDLSINRNYLCPLCRPFSLEEALFVHGLICFVNMLICFVQGLIYFVNMLICFVQGLICFVNMLIFFV